MDKWTRTKELKGMLTMEVVIILCHEHGKLVIASESALNHVCCPLCWHADHIKAIVEPGEQKTSQ